VRQKAIKELPFALAVEDDHWHPTAPKSTHQVLGNDVFEERRFARAGAADNDTVLHANDIGPQPGLRVDVISEQRRGIPIGLTSDFAVCERWNKERRMGPILLAFAPLASELSNNEPTTEKQHGKIHEEFKALGIA
jgi:hypothetical protein